MTSGPKIYQFPFSQPCRSVAWLLKLGSMPHQNVAVNIFKGEHKTPEYLAKHPAGMIPMIETSCGVCAPESAGIMIYLCNANKFTEYYPSCEAARLRINSAMFAHGTLMRPITVNVMFPCVGVMRSKGDSATLADFKEAVSAKLDALKEVLLKIDSFLANRKYVAGTDCPTIADLLAICEINQIPVMGALLPEDIVQFAAYPNLKRYVELMAKVPYHDEFLTPFTEFISNMLPKA